MSIASDLRSYADTAVNQGKQVLDSTLSTAQAQLNDVTGKATSAVHDVRLQAEKAVNFDAIKTAVDPYVSRVKDYTGQVTDRAEGVLNGVKKDKRVAKLVETVEQRVVKPVQSLINRGSKSAPKRATKPATSAATKPATKPAATKPASKPANKPAARKAPAKRATRS
jgi:prophage DNA circulation protein